ncbi:MAG: hypothetical protein ACFHW5_02145 [Verrucomicrobiota bacterium]
MMMKHFTSFRKAGSIWMLTLCLINVGQMDVVSQPSGLQQGKGLWGLKTDPNIGVVVAICGNCHSPFLITHHHRDRSSWDKTITKMESNGLAAPAPVIRKMLLDYLEKHQGALKESRPAASPWGHAGFDANPLWD